MAYRLLGVEVESRYGLTVDAPLGPLEVDPVGREDEAGPGPAEERTGVAAPGPGGRGYGVLTAEPSDLDDRWPRREPWIGEVSR
jgi:hypothetical protein